jgi:hypothetical protein
VPMGLTAHSATASDAVNVTVSPLAINVAVGAASVSSSVDVPCGAVEASLAAYAASVAVDAAPAVGAVSMVLTAHTPGVSAGLTVDVDTAVLALAAREASVAVDALVESGLLSLSLSVHVAAGRPVSRDDIWFDAAVLVLALTQPPAEYRATHLREWIRLQSAPPAAKSRTSAPGSTGNLGGRVLAVKNILSGGNASAQAESPTLEIKPLRSPVDLVEA